ncbi:magnesium/cobalt transporter CorA [Mitsuaria sp. GD03876]|uniref:magnesium/cobalt transporter CorA n=1 Tax=Mitsuaria sp. GD03876 TaxID=2975399 RepID=UPI00244907C8|nr:magnesium/cobalt transporter CorA [Mitsuaria sp. GD03876]MDH0867098.1 magnesium/cobalt transporter CorA [Mitsuaria sp. GD03876]
MLINCVAYRDGRRLADIRPEEISDYLKLPDCFVWVALRDASPEEVLAMKEEFDLHELAVEDALHGQQRPKVEEYGDMLFAVMQTVQFTPTDELCTGEVSIFAGPNFVLSIRNRVAQSLLGVRARAEREPHMLKRGPGFVMYAIMDAVVDRYFPVIEALEAELDAIESQIFEPGVTRENIKRVYALKQRVTIVKHAVSPLLDAVGKLVRGRVPPICEDTREYFRDVYDHLERMQSALDSLRDTATTAIQVHLSMAAIEDSEITKRLAAWAGIFAAATAFAGIWGMNFEVMPELKWRWGYPAALGVITATCGLLFWRFRRAGWL